MSIIVTYFINKKRKIYWKGEQDTSSMIFVRWEDTMEMKQKCTKLDYSYNVGPKTRKSLQTLIINLSDDLPLHWTILCWLCNHRDQAIAWIAPIHNFFFGLVRAAIPPHESLQFKSNWSSVLVGICCNKNKRACNAAKRDQLMLILSNT